MRYVEVQPFLMQQVQEGGLLQPERLALATHSALEKLPSGLLPFLRETLGYADDAMLSTALAPEQVDAVALAAVALSKEPRRFVLADATGSGKGRVLAALTKLNLLKGRPVCFVTENQSLFSDFHRDLLGIGYSAHPILFHRNAIVLNPDGSEFSRELDEKAKEALLKKQIWPVNHDHLFLTTYAWLARALPKSPEGQWLIQWLQQTGALLILDESHNCAGDSQVRKGVLKLVKGGASVIFSSATWVRNEEAMDFYLDAFGVSSASRRVVLSGLSGDGGLLREALALDLAEQGFFLHRSLMPPKQPEPIWLCPPVRELDALRAYWMQLTHLAKRLPLSAHTLLLSNMGRVVRAFTMLVKLPRLLEIIQEEIRLGHKPVVVSESTLDYMRRDDAGLDSLGAYLAGLARGIVATTHASEAILNNLLASASALEQLPSDPLKEAIHRLGERSISAAELSGRSGSTIVRQRLVSNFNAGKSKVLFITRAGCSGISLHASSDFADQSPRTLIEWDVAADPAKRLQFWGRVRRRSQVSEAELCSLWLDTPADHRRYERESGKNSTLFSHLGVAVPEVASYISKRGETLTKEWLRSHPKSSATLGNALSVEPRPGTPFPVVNRALSRALLLPDTEQEALLNWLDQGLNWTSPVPEALAVSAPTAVLDWPTADHLTGVFSGRLQFRQRKLYLPAWDAQKTLEEARASEDATFLQRAELPALLDQLPHPQRNWLEPLAQSLITIAGTRPLAISCTSPGTGVLSRGLLLDLLGTINHEVALSQLGAAVLTMDDGCIHHLPLDVLSQDTGFSILGPATRRFLETRPVETDICTLEGQLLVAAAWGKRWGWGRPGVLSVDGKAFTVWRLPSRFRWDTLGKLPRELFSPQAVMAFWQRSGTYLMAALPAPFQLLAVPVSGGISLIFSSSTQPEQGYLSFQQVEMLGSPQALPDGRVSRFCPASTVARFLHLGWANGLVWAMPPV